MQIPSETHQFQLGLVTMQLCSEVPPYRLWWNAWASAAPDGARASTTKTRLDEEMNEWVMLGSRKSGWLMWETHTHKPPILDGLYMFIHVYTCLYMFIHVYTCLYMFIHVYTCLYMFIPYTTHLLHCRGWFIIGFATLVVSSWWMMKTSFILGAGAVCLNQLYASVLLWACPYWLFRGPTSYWKFDAVDFLG